MRGLLLVWLLFLSVPALATPEAEKVVSTEAFEVRLGSSLMPLLATKFQPRLESVRADLLRDKGYLVGGLRFVADPQLAPGEYKILARGNPLGSGTLEPDRLLVLASEANLAQLPGPLTQDPTYGLAAKWVSRGDQSKAESLGGIVLEDASVWSMQMTELLRQHAAEFYTPEHLKAGLAELKGTEPVLADRVAGQAEKMLAVVRNLLDEGVPVRDLGTIAEVVVNSPRLGQDADSLSEGARLQLAGSLVKDVRGQDGQVAGFEVGPRLEKAILAGTQAEVAVAIQSAVAGCQREGLTPVVLTSPAARLKLHRLTRQQAPSLVVLSRQELQASARWKSLGVVELK